MANKRKCKLKECGKMGRDGVVINMGYYCNHDHAIKFAQANAGKARDKARAKESTANKKALRSFNQKDLSWQHKQTQKAFNKLRVLQEIKWFKDRGLEPECMSCAKKNMDWCCGHFKTVGSAGRLRYDEKNTYLQCNKYCNMSLSGNINGNSTTRGYLQGLRDRFGDDADGIIDYCETNGGVKKWEWQEVESLRTECNAAIRDYL